MITRIGDHERSASDAGLGDKILLLFGRAYSEQATRLLWVLVLATVPMTVNFLFFSVRRVQQKMAWLAAQSLTAAVIHGAICFGAAAQTPGPGWPAARPPGGVILRARGLRRALQIARNYA